MTEATSKPESVREMERERERETDRQTDRQIMRKRARERETDRNILSKSNLFCNVNVNVTCLCNGFAQIDNLNHVSVDMNWLF